MSSIFSRIALGLCICLAACANPNSSNPSTPAAEPVVVGNPPAEGFNESGSDAKAIEIADQVMEAMGGRQAWDNTHFIKWNFFGARTLTWDKFTGDVRIEEPKNERISLVNVHTGEGKVFEAGMELPADSAVNLLQRAKSVWINDSYWLVMPFKLKDSGVTLTYAGTDTLPGGAQADKLQLTFENVGDTPQNKYVVWVDQADHLVKQWAYFKDAQDEEPRFITPWIEYAQYGEIQLSGNRGERKLSDISVSEEMDASVFEGI
ncbi:hypothetical protein [Pontibacter sp. G13]|uniref:hypothetical protein n=1 Tax=Pontibacter sp. G13 TaxID=3074898 RepID=UPI00288A101E|nr:hypothetical protein [Pontibacter sp. G13]WNJ21061.1 hypothetical protein RJD25_11375 [Pontibacter sp. G13]